MFSTYIFLYSALELKKYGHDYFALFGKENILKIAIPISFYLTPSKISFILVLVLGLQHGNILFGPPCPLITHSH